MSIWSLKEKKNRGEWGNRGIFNWMHIRSGEKKRPAEKKKGNQNDRRMRISYLRKTKKESTSNGLLPMRVPNSLSQRGSPWLFIVLPGWGGCAYGEKLPLGGRGIAWNVRQVGQRAGGTRVLKKKLLLLSDNAYFLKGWQKGRGGERRQGIRVTIRHESVVVEGGRKFGPSG